MKRLIAGLLIGYLIAHVIWYGDLIETSPEATENAGILLISPWPLPHLECGMEFRGILGAFCNEYE